MLDELTLGAVVGFERLRANFSKSAATDTLNFRDSADAYPVSYIEGLTEASRPS